MFIVTGGAGFIGSNIIRELNHRGECNILLVDDLTDGHKVKNIADLNIADYMDKDDFIKNLQLGYFNNIEGIYHQGASSSTTVWDGKYLMKNNYEYSKILLEYCLIKKIPYIYASSASVYGMGLNGFAVDRLCENPINMYAYSKFQFDQYVRSILPDAESPVVGLRYFNVYGYGEEHKGSMCSPVYHFHQQLLNSLELKLFGEYGGYNNGEQKRDFVYIDDVVDVNLWFMGNELSGIYNVGTGVAKTFNELADVVIRCHGCGKISYIPFPVHLMGAYQSYTQADISTLRAIGYKKKFVGINEGVSKYLSKLS